MTGRSRCEQHLKGNSSGQIKYKTTERGQSAQKRKLPKNAERKRTQRRESASRVKWNYAKQCARQRNSEWKLDFANYVLLVTQPCCYCGFLHTESGIGLDRLDNNIGYVVGNVVSCCNECNVVRNSNFTPTEMLVLGQVVAQIKHTRMNPTAHLDIKARQPIITECTKSNTRRRFWKSRETASHRGLTWSITREQYNDLVRQSCRYCGSVIKLKRGVGLDRLDNTQGYRLDNVVTCCPVCNTARNDHFSYQEMLFLGQAVAAVKQTRGKAF